MSVIGSNILAGASGQAVGYQVERSLRFNSSDSGYCSRTFTSAGNRKTWTWAAWVKRSRTGEFNYLFDVSGTGVREAPIRFDDTDSITVSNINDPFTGIQYELKTSAVYRDLSAWYHIVVALDTTQASSSDRLKLYVNGERVTAFATATYPAQNTDYGINSNVAHYIGRYTFSPGRYLNGYLADVHFIDGQALTPSSFTEVSATTGQLIPKAYTGTFGTNGFWLKFSDNSNNTAATLGKDYSPNGNNWTPNNLSVTAGAGNDSLVDTPTSYGTDTGAGGEVRGNYCTLNPLSTVLDTLSNGNLDWTSINVGATRITKATFGLSVGKWFAEFTATSTTTFGPEVGVCTVNATGNSGLFSQGYGYVKSGNKYIDATASAYGATWTTGDVIGVALDLDSNQITFYKNGASQGAISITSGLTWNFGCIGQGSADSGTWNFGQRPFAYTAPSGFKALCDTNLPTPVVAKPSTVFDTKLYTGNGSTQTISGLGFSPDLVWVKQRTSAAAHVLVDTVRGSYKLSPNQTLEELAGGAFYGSVSPTSDGFSLVQGSDTDPSYGGFWEVGANAKAYAAWCWDAGSSNSTNTQGSITSSVRANTSAGFSVVTWTGTGGAGTVGHGLGVAPTFLIVKNRSRADDWLVYSSTQGANKFLQLNTTNAVQTATQPWNNTSPTSTVFSVFADTGTWTNKSGDNYVAYAFSPVVGYSSAFSYTGTNSSEGPFVHLGFKPRLILVKRTDAAQNWFLFDSARNTYNSMGSALFPNLSDAENTGNNDIDFLSNGFKIRFSGTSGINQAGTYIGFAWAENPFQYARAR